MICRACNQDDEAEATLGAEVAHLRGMLERLRALAAHLETRGAAPSLDGYAMADGLRAAADLLDGKPGPMVDADLAGAGDVWSAPVPLRSLL